MLLVGFMVPASPGCTRLIRATFAERRGNPGLAGLLQQAVPRWLAHLTLHVSAYAAARQAVVGPACTFVSNSLAPWLSIKSV